MLIAPPLSLYIHIPWCVEKCPYCDFNSHALKHAIPEQDYVAQLLLDLDTDIARFNLQQRPLHSIFIGGGTPSLFSAPAIEQLLTQVLQRFEHKADIEITLEANPGTVEAEKFIGFFNGGVSRLSVGVQSFESDKLIKLGRIHDSQQAKTAANLASECGVKSFNLDLMHGLPEQTVEHALDDLKTAISLKPTHISWYQLTIEPNTAFHSRPPKLPQDEILWNIQDQGIALLNEAGYQQYEISAYSKPEYQCQHNLNYWQFGDYLGIGCGAHGKITDVDNQQIYRTVKVKHPKGYLDTSRKALDKIHTVTDEELPFEYMMNRLRLHAGFSLDEFKAYTGLSEQAVLPTLLHAQEKQLMEFDGKLWSVSKLGHRYLNDLLEMFL
ncbi:radical SAM family heme chaperone HemW [Cognaticolwellia mytili]|uniref:radical SAM family heme chaperone HemW n=1 Tax=Cognaticolwellia mytili TaxID=1888913 RepID=UPI000A177C51|nr:radical SAM family heme chaperone HemW [Cognaticolwellia mytili]